MANSKVLLIDDDQMVHEVVKGALEEQYGIESVCTGEEGISVIKDRGADLALIDINLPDMKGFELCEKLRKNKRSSNMPIIMISATDDREEQLRGYELGADDFIPKPIDINELEVKVGQVLGRAKQINKIEASSKKAKTNAMAAMQASNEMGEIVRFMERSMSEQDPIALAQDIVMTTDRFGFDCSVQLHALDMVINFDGSVLPDDATVSKVMTFARTKGKIEGYKNRVFFNEEFVTILIKNMPEDDPETSGRARDTLCMLIDGSNSVMRAIRLRQELMAIRNSNTFQIIGKCVEELKHLPSHLGEVVRKSLGVVDNIQAELQGKLIGLDLTEEQEEEIFSIISQAHVTVDALKDTEVIIEEAIDSVYNNLKSIAQL